MQRLPTPWPIKAMFAFAVLLYLAGVLFGRPPQAPKPPQAPPVAEEPAPQPSYGGLREAAIREAKPLIVWVGYKCPSSAVQVPGMLHYHAPGEEWAGYRGPGVLVGVPGGDGRLYVAEWLGAADCCATNIRAAVERALRSWEGRGQNSQALYQGRPVQSAVFMRHVRGWAASVDGVCRG